MSEAGKTTEAEPLTTKDRVIGGVQAVVVAGLGVTMLLYPVLGIVPDGADPSGRGSRRILGLLRLVEWIWSRPVGVILCLLAALVLFSAFFGKGQLAGEHSNARSA